MARVAARFVLPYLLSCGFALPAQAQPAQGETPEQRQTREAILAKAAAENAAHAKMPRADIDMDRVPKAHPRRPSAWRSAEKAFYQDVLAKGRFEVLVAPVQVQNHAFARDLRSLMTAQLVTAMSAAGSPPIPDPYLVARALGDGERRHDLKEIFDLANKLQAKRIVLAYVGHDPRKAGTMRITLHYYDRGDQGRFWEAFLPTANQYGALFGSERLNATHFDGLAFSDENTPIDAFHAALPGMLKFLGLSARAASPVESRAGRAELPASPLSLQAGKAEPARDAYYFQLLAALTPGSAERVRERLVEKSMLAIQQMSPKSPDYRALKARALMNLGMRPAALHALGTPASAEEAHLFALLNGNLPELQSNRPKIAPGVRAVIASLEENAVAAAYEVRTADKSRAEAGALALSGKAWPMLAAWAMNDWDRWTQRSNLGLKGLLDVEFPLEGFTAEGMVRGAAAVGDARQLDTRAELSVLDHVRRQTQKSAAEWCCQPLAARPTARDYLDLLEGLGTANLLRRANFLVHTQGQPESGIEFLARIDGVYKEHPQFVVVRAEAELEISKGVSGSQNELLRRSAYAAAFDAWYWEQTQTRTAADAFEDVITPARRSDFGAFDNFYAADYPFRSFYPFWTFSGAMEPWLKNARLALQNSSFDFEPVTEIVSSLGRQERWEQVDELLKSVEDRFAGHPKKVQLLADSSLRRNDVRGAEKHYREGIRAQPMDEASYSKLGRLLFAEATPEKAASVFMSYPGLSKPREVNTVELSNYAYEAGSLFYWSGQFDLARPLYETAAGLRTGSDASIASRLRLDLLKGDYAAALQGSLERGQRYRSSYAFRDALGLMHVMGRSSEAWDAFNTMAEQMDQPHLWETALVGLWMRGSSEKQVAEFAAMRRNAGRRYAYAPMVLLRAGVVDRTPSRELPALIASVERPVWKLQNVYGSVVAATTDPDVHVVLGPPTRNPRDATLAGGVFQKTDKVRVKSHFVYFAEAYRALRAGQFDAARAALQEAEALYDVKNESLGYLLPYYAYAAAKTRNVAAVEGVLDSFPAEYRRFDYYLSKAVIAALAGKAGEADAHLKLALHRRPFTERRPVFPEYQYAELLEWLFESAGDARYREAALAWARQNQAFQPWFAWAYAIEAKLATGQERSRAIAMTHYLDKNSERLSKLPKNEVETAVKEYTGRNPFLTPAASRRPI